MVREVAQRLLPRADNGPVQGAHPPPSHDCRYFEGSRKRPQLAPIQALLVPGLEESEVEEELATDAKRFVVSRPVTAVGVGMAPALGDPQYGVGGGSYY
jgi:hypothetical protein